MATKRTTIVGQTQKFTKNLQKNLGWSHKSHSIYAGNTIFFVGPHSIINVAFHYWTLCVMKQYLHLGLITAK